MTLLLVSEAEGNFAVALDGHDEVLLKVVLDELAIVGRGVTDIIYHILQLPDEANPNSVHS